MAEKKLNKTGITGRYGARYGRKIREDVRKIEMRQRAKHKCPQCGKAALKRISAGVWRCTKCGVTTAGGAFMPQTGLGLISQRAIHGAPLAEVVAQLEATAQPEGKGPEAPEPKKAKHKKAAPEPPAEAAGNAPEEAV